MCPPPRRPAIPSPSCRAPATRTSIMPAAPSALPTPTFTDFTYQDRDHHDVRASLTPEQLAAIHSVETALTLTPAATNAHDGTVTWSYDVADSAFDFVADGETLTLIYTATVDDGHGGVVSTPITVSIHGADIS